VILRIENGSIEIADWIEFVIVTHLPSQMNQGYGFHEVQHLVKLFRRILDDILLKIRRSG
jgi:hypothetical protein